MVKKRLEKVVAIKYPGYHPVKIYFNTYLLNNFFIANLPFSRFKQTPNPRV